MEMNIELKHHFMYSILPLKNSCNKVFQSLFPIELNLLICSSIIEARVCVTLTLFLHSCIHKRCLS